MAHEDLYRDSLPKDGMGQKGELLLGGGGLDSKTIHLMRLFIAILKDHMIHNSHWLQFIYMID